MAFVLLDAFTRKNDGQSKIIGHLYSGALLSHRSAFEYRPTSSGDIFLTCNYERRIKLQGVTLNMMTGSSALSDDLPFVDGLNVSGQTRAILENLQSSRRPGPSSKTLTLPEVEEKLEQIVRTQGEDALNALRDRARDISGQLGMKKEFEKLDRLIRAILTTKPSGILKSSVALARAFGQPFDPKRIELFENLFVTLKQAPISPTPDPNMSNTAFKNFALYEAYFSNFIEGTEFKLEEAMKIINPFCKGALKTSSNSRDEEVLTFRRQATSFRLIPFFNLYVPRRPQNLASSNNEQAGINLAVDYAAD